MNKRSTPLIRSAPLVPLCKLLDECLWYRHMLDSTCLSNIEGNFRIQQDCLIPASADIKNNLPLLESEVIPPENFLKHIVHNTPPLKNMRTTVLFSLYTHRAKDAHLRSDAISPLILIIPFLFHRILPRYLSRFPKLIFSELSL